LIRLKFLQNTLLFFEFGTPSKLSPLFLEARGIHLHSGSRNGHTKILTRAGLFVFWIRYGGVDKVNRIFYNCVMNRKELLTAMRKKGLTYAKIGRFFGLSKQRIHKILNPRKTQESTVDNPIRLNLTKLTGMPKGSRDRTRELVRIRDFHTCQICFKKWRKGERRFDVHHLDEKYEGLQGEGRNGTTKWDREHLDKMLTLCHKCHFNLDQVRRKMSLARRKRLGRTSRN